jgi:hypothetical protein
LYPLQNLVGAVLKVSVPTFLVRSAASWGTLLLSGVGSALLLVSREVYVQ